MVIGYPGRTQRYQTAAQLEQMIQTNRIAIDARTIRQDIMWEAMCADPSVQLKYADKYASSANGWKKWQGEELAFKNLGIIQRELDKEAALQQWIDADPARKEKYGTAIQDIAAQVQAKSADSRAVYYLAEGPLEIELIGLAAGLFNGMQRQMAQGVDQEEALKKALENIQDDYRDYVVDIDKKEAVALLEFYRLRAKPEDYLQNLGADFALMDIPSYVDTLFATSNFN